MSGWAAKEELEFYDVSSVAWEPAGAPGLWQRVLAGDKTTGDDARRYYQSVSAPADERVRSLKLLWDFVGTEFAGRQLQYEMFYSPAQHVADARIFHAYDWADGRELVDRCLAAYGLSSP